MKKMRIAILVLAGLLTAGTTEIKSNAQGPEREAYGFVTVTPQEKMAGSYVDDEIYPELLRGETWEGSFRDELSKVINACETNRVDVKNLSIPVSCVDKQVKDIIGEVLTDCYGDFYFSGGFGYSYNPRTEMINSVTLNYDADCLGADGLPDWNTIKSKRDALIAAYKKYLGCIPNNITDLEKVLFINDLLCRECDYDLSGQNNQPYPCKSYSLYGVFVDNVAVCTGYAKAFKKLCNENGIDCVIVSSDHMVHAWNMVKLSGYWYHVDCTWNDPLVDTTNDYWCEGYVSHKYFLMSDSEITSDTGEHYGINSGAPKAVMGKAYQGYIFRKYTDTAFNCYNGIWYYSNGNSVVSSTITGDNLKTLISNIYPDFVHSFNDCMYIAYDGCIDVYGLPGMNHIEKVLTASSYGFGDVSEFAIKNENMSVVMTGSNGSGGRYKKIVTPLKYLYNPEGVKPTETPTATPTAHPTETPNIWTRPTETPTRTPDIWIRPTATPTQRPTELPTQTPDIWTRPTATPSLEPGETEAPSTEPTQVPGETEVPSAEPTQAPKETEVPSAEPTQTPGETVSPTAEPTQTPMPTLSPNATKREKIQAFVYRLYELCLFRTPDESGFEFWTNQLESGAYTGAKCAEYFMFSPEITAKKLDNEEFLKVLYRAMMGREYDDGGLAFWKSFLDDGIGKQYIVKGFLDSKEFGMICGDYGIETGKMVITEGSSLNPNLTRFIARMYTVALNREFDRDGIDFWCSEIYKNPKRLMDVCTGGFFDSPEFINRNLDDEEYIKVLYRTFFGREYDLPGLQFWYGELRNGKTRVYVRTAFAYTTEFEKVKKSFGL
ncbi:MAG: DUF4214 domain-containing protein [Lachnospiraceae bacterium]|nr:DUF4214 domain-containing protein [Lachnospiraceae bacterium]